MNSVMRGLAAGAAVVTLAGGYLSNPAVAAADPELQPEPAVDATPAPEVLHNVVYRARIDGVSRGATIVYAAENDQTLTANPTMVPGRVFEVNTVLPATEVASMKVSVQWPYSANLHCEVLVDDQLVAQADDFVAPRFLPQDPDYAVLTCEAPVGAPPAPIDPAAPPPPEPADPAAPPPPAI
ncbi:MULTISPECIES: hypothetical protein [Mycobacteriaceae]|uniref:hypothetical protein n=1 Tax=Mycobacteriaceae TaxID=1762 RepID=UPI0007FFF8A8|nr:MULTISPECIES: hypothetical protein [Mycobacteriaceae]MCK0173295.1 hypothetical protein [Mycolicibacterium sp. F2034L]OBB62291.1 hypothetical protein A5757_00090 [Mycobacterium sp. 852013-51886_SCH5428379]